MDAIVKILESIFKWITLNILKRPYYTQGGIVELQPNKQESVVIEVPAEWSDNWTIYCTPSDNYYQSATGRAVARVKIKIDLGTGKSVTRHNAAPRQYNGISVTNPGANSNIWLDSSIVGEAFHVSGKSATVSVRNVMSTGTQSFNFEVSASRGSPCERDRTAIAETTSISTFTGIPIPRWSKKIKFTVGSSAYDLRDLPSGGFVDANNNYISRIMDIDWPMFAEQLTSDSVGGIVSLSRDSRFIEIPCNAIGFKFELGAVAVSYLPTWKITE